MNEEKIKKSYRNYAWLIIFVVFLYAFVVIKTLFDSNNNFFVGSEKTKFIIIAVISGFLLYTIIYQLGKIVFALLLGFKIVAVNILVIDIKNHDGKWKIDFAFPEGCGGNVHVLPKKEDEKCFPLIYQFGGVIFVVLFAVLLPLIFYFVDSTRKMAYIALVLSLISIVVLLANFIPLYTDGINDGFTMRLLLNKDNTRVYMDNLRQYTALNYGIGELKKLEYDNYGDVFQTKSLIYQYYYYIKNNDLVNAEKTCLKILEHKEYLSDEEVDLAEVNKLYFILLKEDSDKCYDYYYSLDKEYRKYALSTNNYETLKVGFLLAGKVEKTYDLYEHLLKYENKLKDNYYPLCLENEKVLIANAKKIVLDIFPDWEN